jgi:hypothetical protein
MRDDPKHNNLHFILNILYNAKFRSKKFQMIISIT